MREKQYPDQFGPYTLLEKIAQGGMAEVFIALKKGSEGFSKQICIKRILGRFEEHDEFIEMLIDEAKISAQLIHPNIVQVHDLGEVKGQYYIAMDFVEGMDLRHLIKLCQEKKIGFPKELAVYIIDQVLKALDFAHNFKDGNGKELKIIHRDISPQNVLLSNNGEVKLGDFGIAQSLEKEHETQTGVLKGKYAYMSPEQSRGDYLAPSSDLFAVGVMFFEMIFGEKPFGVGSDPDVLHRIRRGEILWPEFYQDKLDAAWIDWLEHALQADPRNRYQSAHEMRKALAVFPKTDSDQLKEFIFRIQNTQAEITHTHRFEEDFAQNTFLRSAATENKSFDEGHPKLIAKKKSKFFSGWMSQALVLLIMFSVLLGIFSLAYTSKESNLDTTIENSETTVKKISPHTVTSNQVAGIMEIEVKPDFALIRAEYQGHLVEQKGKLKIENVQILDQNHPVKVNITASGYHALQKEIVLHKDSEQVQFTLNKKIEELGGLTVNALPWGKVSIPGLVSQGSTPFTRKGLKAGPYWVKVSDSSGSNIANRRVVIKNGKVSKCFVNFKKNAVLSCR